MGEENHIDNDIQNATSIQSEMNSGNMHGTEKSSIDETVLVNSEETTCVEEPR